MKVIIRICRASALLILAAVLFCGPSARGSGGTIVPAIKTPPVSQTVAVGSSISLTVRAIGAEPMYYQWKLAGTPLAGATNDTLPLPDIQVSQAGAYTVTASNYAGFAVSDAALIDVFTSPFIVTQPKGKTLSDGDNVTLSVTATGEAPLRYQWRLNGATLAGATNASLVFAHVRATNAGAYTVVVANPVGAVVSADAKLSFGGGTSTRLKDSFASRITTNNAASGEIEGNNLLATKETGEPNHAGRPGGASVWYAWTAPASGTVTFTTSGSSFDTLLAIYTGTSINNLTEVASNDDFGGFFTSKATFRATNGIMYQIAVDGVGGTTGEIELEWDFASGNDDIPQFAMQPQSQSVTNGATVQFSFLLTLDDDLNTRSHLGYQWLHNGQPLAGATATNLMVTNVQADNLGLYHVVVKVTNNSVSTTFSSAPANLELQKLEAGQTPVPDRQSHDKFIDVLASVPSGPTTLALRTAAHTAGFTVSAGVLGTQILNNFGATTEPLEPLIAGTPGGSSRWFSIQAGASGTMVIDTMGSDFDTLLGVYAGASLLSLAEIASDNNSAPDGLRSRVSFPAVNGTTYLVAVDGVNGAQGTVVLNWRLGTPPEILQPPAAQAVLAGGSVTLNVAATGTPAPVYQWRLNGLEITNATNATLVLDGFQLASQGSYSVVASNMVGTVTSASAFLALEVPAQFGPPAMITDGSFQFQYTGTARRNYVLQTATELTPSNTVWTALMTNSDPNGVFNFVEPNATNHHRFYRVISPQ